MAIQQTLDKVSVAEMVKDTGGSYGRSNQPTSKTADLFTGASDLLKLADQGISMFKVADKASAVKGFNSGLANIIEAKTQGSITSAEARTRVNELFLTETKERPELAQTFIANTESMYGSVPFKTAASAEAKERDQAIQNGFRILGPNATVAEAEQAGREALNKAQAVAVAGASLKAATENRNATSVTITRKGIQAVNSIVDSAMLSTLAASAIGIAGSTTDLNEKAMADNAFSSVRQLIRQVDLQVTDALTEVVDPTARKDILESWEQRKKTFNDIFDPEKGALELGVVTKFYKAAQDKLGLEMTQSTQLISRIKSVLGPQATASLMNTIINNKPDTQTGFIKMIEVSKNQYSSNIIAIVKNTKAPTKALDKALQKHSTKQGQSTVSIDKQLNKEQVTTISVETFLLWFNKKKELNNGVKGKFKVLTLNFVLAP